MPYIIVLIWGIKMKKHVLNKSIEKALKAYFRAYYPLIYIFSYEEDRVEYYLEVICKDLQLNLFSWDLVEGFVKIKDEKVTKIPNDQMDYADYLNCLSFIEKADNKKSIFLLKDFHPAFALDSAGQIVRKIRNVIVDIRVANKIMVFLIPPNCEKSAVPPELEKEIVLYRFPVPSLREGVDLLDQVIEESLGNTLPVNLKANEKEKLAKAGLGLTTNEMENAFIKASLADKQVGMENIKLILEEKKQLIEKTGILQYFSTDIEKTEIGGLEELKHWLDENDDMFDEKAAAAGCDIPKGILLIGVPGCGKSLSAKVLASQWKMPLLRFDLSAVFGGIVGESEANMRRALEAAESIAPCVLWVDEIEKGLSGMTSATSGDSGTSQRVFGTLVSWMQERTAPVFFVATANDISRISNTAPELLRSGRFDEIFFVDLPNSEERKEIFSIHLRKRKEDPDKFDLTELAKISVGFSGSDIEQTVKDAKRASFLLGEDLNDVTIKSSLANRLPVAVTMKEKIEELRDWAALRARLASKRENEEAIESLAEYEKKRGRRRIVTIN
jgi:SpoVK/Ycf46/Vps4 family AAA+-type ATPase